MTNSGSADETESEMRTRKTRQTACSRKRIWKACARQKSPRIVFEADLWKMLKNSTPWVWLEWIEFFSFFQHFSAFWKLMNAHFSKNSCYSRYSIINEWPHCIHPEIMPCHTDDALVAAGRLWEICCINDIFPATPAERSKPVQNAALRASEIRILPHKLRKRRSLPFCTTFKFRVKPPSVHVVARREWPNFLLVC